MLPAAARAQNMPANGLEFVQNFLTNSSFSQFVYFDFWTKRRFPQDSARFHNTYERLLG